MLCELAEKLRGAGKAGYFALIMLFFLGLAGLYVADVWALGTAAAALQGVGAWIEGQSIFATAAQKAAAARAFDHVAWYCNHPLQTAWAWLTRPAGQLANPGVRVIWLVLNALVFLGGAVLRARWKFSELQKAARKEDRDIRDLRFKKIEFNLQRELSRTPEDKLFLGLDDRRRPIYVPVSKMVEHVHVLGGSGTGKTSLAVLPVCIQALRRNMAVIVIDFKGDKGAIQVLHREAKAAGKKFYLFSLYPGIQNNTYNPLGSGNVLTKVERIMTALQLVFEGEAKFYTYCQQAVFLPLLKYFDSRGVKYTLKDIRALLDNPGLVQEITGDEMAPRQVKGLTAALTPYADLDIINDPEPDIDLVQVMEAGDVVYFDLRSAVAPELSAALGKMIAMDLQALAAFRTEHDRMTLVAIDEFQNMACQAFRNIISKVRSANYALVLANQALGDLRAVGDDFLNTVATNTRTKIVFNIDDPADAEYFARKSGQVVIPVEGRSRSTSRPAGQLTGGSESNSESVHEQEKHLVHANILLKLPFKKSVIYQRGELAVLANHSHLITRAEKDRLGQEPYPGPQLVVKQGVKTFGQLIAQMKQEVVVEEGQGQGSGRPPQRPGQVENAGVEAEDIAM